MDISIIVVNYNTLKLTKQCIDSIYQQTTDVSFEVILVDNDSKDGSAEHFSQDTRIKFIQSGANLGFGKANNLGYEHSSGKYIFLLNSDTKLLNNALKIFFDYMEAAPLSIGCCGTMLLNAQEERFLGNGAYGGEQKSCLKYISESIFKPFTRVFSNKKGLNTEIPAPPFQVGYVVGADLFMRRSVIEECGLFDNDFFMYYEEMELQHRYAKAGYTHHIIDGPRIIHFVKASTKGKINPKLIQMQTHGRFLYYKKTNSRISYLLFRMFEIIRIPFELSRSYTLSENLKLFVSFFKRANRIMQN